MRTTVVDSLKFTSLALILPGLACAPRSSATCSCRLTNSACNMLTQLEQILISAIAGHNAGLLHVASSVVFMTRLQAYGNAIWKVDAMQGRLHGSPNLRIFATISMQSF